MNKIFKLVIFAFVVVIISSCDDMSSNSRIKNNIALKKINKIALMNFSIMKDCSISGEGDDVSYIKNGEITQEWGKYHLFFLNEIIKTRKSPMFLDLNEMVKSDIYQNFKLENTYIANRKESLPVWLSPGVHFVNTFKGVGIVLINSTNSRKFCKSLNTDAVLSIQLTYGIIEGINFPIFGNFIKPKWKAFCKIKSELFNNVGELVWHYDCLVKSPLKISANKSLNLILYSSSSINGKQTYELIKSVQEYSSNKIINALYSDINKNK